MNKILSCFGAVLFCANIGAMESGTTPISQESLPVTTAAPLKIDAISDFDQRTHSLFQGAVINFSEVGTMSTIKKGGQLISGVANPYWITGTSVLCLLNRSDMDGLLGRVAMNNYSGGPLSIQHIKNQLTYSRSKESIAWILDINKDISAVTLKLWDLELAIGTRSIYYRNLNQDVMENLSYNRILDVLASVIGRPAEILPQEEILAVKDKNQTENVSRFFPSELTAYFYKSLGIIPSETNCTNVIPAELSAGAGMGDVLYGKAGIDVLLKQYGVQTVGGCCGCLLL